MAAHEMNGREFERESFVEWEPLFDVGCVTGRPAVLLVDAGEPEPSPDRIQKTDGRDHVKTGDDNPS